METTCQRFDPFDLGNEAHSACRLFAENLVLSMNDGLSVLDLKGCHILVNPALCRMTGFLPDELVGKGPPHPYWSETVEDRQKIEAALMRTMAGDFSESELVFQKKSGERFPVLVNPSAVKSPHGTVVCYLATVKDISAVTQLKMELESSMEMFRTLVENATDVVCIFQDGLIRYISRRAEALLGYTEEALTDVPFGRFIHPEDRDMVVDRHRRRIGGETVASVYPFRLVHRSGHIVWVEGNAALTVWKGNPAVLSHLRNITQRKALEAQLFQAQKLESVGRLAGGVAHDFNNLLTIIVGYGELLLNEMDSGHPHRELLNEIHQAAHKAQILTRQLLAFSRTQTLEIKTRNLNGIITEFEKMIRRMLREDIEMELSLAPRSVWVDVDVGQVEQVLMNLAVNARDAMPNGGRLIIETEAVELDDAYAESRNGVVPGRYIQLTVTDSGTGMDADTLSRIFEPFFTTKTKDQGTGLGLSTVYGIVKQHGGNIWVYSEPGKGTTFKIYWPEAAESENPMGTESTSGPPLQPDGQQTIFVVEDDPSVRRLVCRILRKSGYDVIEPESPEAAVEMARKYSGPIHLLVVDVIMPNMKGPEVFQQISKLHPETRVIYMSGYPPQSIMDQSLFLKGVDFIRKPLMVKPFLEKVAACLHS